MLLKLLLEEYKKLTVTSYFAVNVLNSIEKTTNVFYFPKSKESLAYETFYHYSAYSGYSVTISILSQACLRDNQDRILFNG